MTGNAVVILQARVASRRLPGKAVAMLGGRTILARCVSRLQESAVPVVLATTERPEDDQLEEEAERLGVRTFRGPCEDVLARFVQAARALQVDYVVRATADNPFVDIAAPARVLALIAATGADYATETGLPVGAAVEAVTVDALVRADRVATDPSDREHVTTLIRRDHSCFHPVERRAPAALRRPDLSFTVDTAEHLDYMRRLLSVVVSPVENPPLANFIAAAEILSPKRRER
jgi:spore coat polysaccharide biosynthesis protein SpsF